MTMPHKKLTIRIALQEKPTPQAEKKSKPTFLSSLKAYWTRLWGAPS